MEKHAIPPCPDFLIFGFLRRGGGDFAHSILSEKHSGLCAHHNAEANL